MKAAGLAEHEKVQVLNITNGNRIETYTLKGKAGSGQICINGAAAHLINKGDLIIIVAYCLLEESEIVSHEPVVIHVDDENQITQYSTNLILN